MMIRTTLAAALLASVALVANAQAQDAPADPATQSIGVNLNGLVLLGPNAPVGGGTAGQVSANGLELIDGAILVPVLQPLIGRPISQALISDIEAEVVTAYRAAGYPFVAVATPPQEITSGILNLRVVPFRSAGITVTGTDAANAERIRNGIRQQDGTFIAARQLEEDLYWLNRSPARLVAAEFTPGTAPSTTDITLAVTESRRWQFSLGLSNAGSVETGEERLSFGIVGSDIFRPGDALFYRGSASFDIGENDLPNYLGHTLQYIMPLAARQELAVLMTLTDTVETPDDVFVLDSRTEEIVVTWASALSNFGTLPVKSASASKTAGSARTSLRRGFPAGHRCICNPAAPDRLGARLAHRLIRRSASRPQHRLRPPPQPWRYRRRQQ